MKNNRKQKDTPKKKSNTISPPTAKQSGGLLTDIPDRLNRAFTLSRKEILVLLAISISLFVIGLLANRESIQYIMSKSTDEIVLATEEFDKGAITFPGATITGNPIKSEFGLATGPNSQWSVTWKGKDVPEAVSLVHLNAFNQPGTINSLVFTNDRVSTFTLNGNYNGTIIKPNSVNDRSEEYSVTFLSRGLPTLAKPALVLDRMVVGSKVFPQGALSPHFYQVLWLAIVPFAAWPLANMLSRKRASAIVAATLLGVLYTVLFFASPATFKIAWCLLPLCVIVYGIQLSTKAASPARPPLYSDIVCGLILALSVLPLRWSFLAAMASNALPPDSIHFIKLAQTMTHPYDTQYREPGFVWLIRLWFAITNWSPVSIRVLTVLLSLLVAFATWMVSRLFCPPVVSFLVMTAVALNPALLGSSTQGLREELFPLSLLSYVYFAVSYHRNQSRHTFICLMLTAALVPLIRLSGLSFVIVTTAVLFALTRTGVRRWIIATSVLLVFLAPMVIYQGKKYGDPMYASNTYVATFYRNHEFQDQPGFPTKAEVLADPWAGEQLGMARYMFGLHSVSEVFKRVASGTYSLFVGKAAQEELLRLNPNITMDYQGWTILPKAKPNLWEKLVVFFFAIGLISLFFQRDRWYILLCLLGIQVPLAFLEGSNLIGWRLSMNVIPLMLVTAGIGMTMLVPLYRKAAKTLTAKG